MVHEPGRLYICEITEDQDWASEECLIMQEIVCLLNWYQFCPHILASGFEIGGDKDKRL